MPEGRGGILSVVGTPIGNLRDASPRVLETLGAADVVLCEDTRVTGRLMSAFGLHVRLERCDENVMGEKVDRVLARLAALNAAGKTCPNCGARAWTLGYPDNSQSGFVYFKE